jgi:hypothetical protein
LKRIVSAFNEMQKDRERREWRRFAWFTAILLSPYTKKGRIIDYENLLPENMRAKKPMTKKDAKKELESLKRDLNIK